MGNFLLNDADWIAFLLLVRSSRIAAMSSAWAGPSEKSSQGFFTQEAMKYCEDIPNIVALKSISQIFRKIRLPTPVEIAGIHVAFADSWSYANDVNDSEFRNTICQEYEHTLKPEKISVKASEPLIDIISMKRDCYATQIGLEPNPMNGSQILWSRASKIGRCLNELKFCDLSLITDRLIEELQMLIRNSHCGRELREDAQKILIRASKG